jgi:AcrR family transcriptional regulator
MDAKAPTQERKSARERLLAAAAELFYEEGINTVGIDRIIERAGVAKASLYDVFGSKEELVRSYLAERDAARRARIEEGLQRYKTPRDKILGIFDLIGEAFSKSSFRGCPFLRASAEVKPTSPARAVCADTRAWNVALFTRLAKEAGVANPKKVAQQLLLLYDGATVAAQMDRDVHAASTARAMAAAVLDASAR